MPAHLDLVITADYPRRTAEFTLRDSDGVQLAFRQTDFKNISVSHQRGLFDLRNHIRLYVEDGKKRAAVEEIGVCIAEEVLGKEIFERLWESESQRTLRIQLPGASDTENYLAAALARVPWEIALPKAGSATLGERNLLVRVVHDMKAPHSAPIDLAANEPLRVLFVFAEARGSRPLGARKERLELSRLFEREIYPLRRIVAHFLTHGVTRERLHEQIKTNSGYHVVHWSGHGHMNLLELCKPGGASDQLSGNELLDLFNEAGGFLPRLFFLSACHSGDILRVKDWNDFLAVAQGKERSTKEASTKELDLSEQPGYTGTAHSLLQGGVPSVVAMRYAVGDDYARELAVEFYRALLAHAQPKNVAAALTMARQVMLDGKRHDIARFDICDRATPVLYGEEQPGITLVKGRSPELNPRNPRLHQIVELSTAGHEHFVGRTWELVGLGADFIGSSMGTETKPVAVITGLGGMGKTALTAEALALWESRFEWVLLFQAKPNALGFDATLRDIHMKLMGELKLYHDHVRANPADAIYRDVTTEFTGPPRLERMIHNLLRALKDEPILIVLDNFENNLKPQADPGAVAGQPVWACQDDAWEMCLALLAKELVGSPSRVLITCRRPLTALTGWTAHPILLGPLPGAEAALFLKEHPALSPMIFGGDDAERALALRLLNASRFHPLLMDRLAKLAADASLRLQLLAAIEALENTKNFAHLPALFATAPGDAKELAYLDDALASSLEQLIRGSSPYARTLLWIIAVANQPEALRLVEDVWLGESLQQAQLRRIKKMLDMMPGLPAETQAKLTAMPTEIRAALDALPSEMQVIPDFVPLLSELVTVGLATEQRNGPEDDNPNLTCHELVRERIFAWMEQHSLDRNALTENAIRLAYAERLVSVFMALEHQNMTAALQAGSRAVVYCIQADAWERLGGFAARLVTGTIDSRFLAALVPHLQTAAESAPEGQLRWACLCYLADALNRGGRPDASLPFYEQAATQARAAAEAGGDASQEAWTFLAVITSNWAAALGNVGDLYTARQLRLDGAEASKKAGRPAIHVIANELEAMRIDIMQGKTAATLPDVVSRLEHVEAWWQQDRSGQAVAEAPDAEFLVRVLLGALNIAVGAHVNQKDWSAALGRIDEALAVERALERPAEQIAGNRMNRANVLGRLGRYEEARSEMEACLSVFESMPQMSSKVLSSLADLLDEQGDVPQAIAQERRALALCEQMPDPADRAISHNNLATYLERSGTPLALAESARHLLAALPYRIVAGLNQHLKTSLGNYALRFRRAHAAGVELRVPRITELLADPAFAPLEQWLRQRQVDIAELQSMVDDCLDKARQLGLSQK